MRSMLTSPIDEMRRRPVKIVDKKWGYEIWLENSSLYCAKLLLVSLDYRCSMHFHERKSEMFYILEGKIELELDGRSQILEPGDIVDIRPYQHHRFTGRAHVERFIHPLNSLFVGSIILEVSTQHFESDSIRTEEGGYVPGG